MSKHIVIRCDRTRNEIEGNLSNDLKLFRVAQKHGQQRVYCDPEVTSLPDCRSAQQRGARSVLPACTSLAQFSPRVWS